MPEKSEKELLRELYQAVIGIPENPKEGGLIGKVDDITTLLKAQNSRIGKTEQRVSKIWGILLGVGFVSGTGLGLGIRALVGG